jgi:Tfp pilus assembly protein PilN
MRQINLLPLEIQRAEQIRSIRNSIIVILAPVLAVLLGIHFLLTYAVQQTALRAAQPPEQIDTPEINQVRTALRSEELKMSQFVNSNKPMIQLITKDFSMTDILKVINTVIENKVWFTSLKVDTESKRCEIDGKSFNTRLVSEFMLELKRAAYFQDVELISMNISNNAANDEVDFKIICLLK